MEPIAEANRKHFDEMAAIYETREDFKTLIAQMTAFLRANLAFIHPRLAAPPSAATPELNPFHLLDYACGPGTVTHALAPHITHATGVDVSANMVAAYNARFSAPPPHAHALVGDLLAPSTAPAAATPLLPDLVDFDLAAVGMGFHHFGAHADAVARLAARLRPGGVLLIVDFAPHGDDFMAPAPAAPAASDGDAALHAAKHTVTKHGFSAEEVAALFEGAGLVEAGYRVMEGDAVIGTGERKIVRKVFMARGRKVEGSEDR